MEEQNELERTQYFADERKVCIVTGSNTSTEHYEEWFV